MSKYQYIAFCAIDAPVNATHLAYMRKQSSRAQITSWSFTNEYHYGDFRGDAMKMLRRGYDMHLHYADFGTRLLCIRLPHGFPDNKAVKPYLDGESLRFVKDTRGSGGILVIEPYYEPGDLEDSWEIDTMLDRLIALRSEILEGDLRPLYLAHLAVTCDGEHDPDAMVQVPVPAGLGELTETQRVFAEFYAIDESLIAACAEGDAPLPSQADTHTQYTQWLCQQTEATKDTWLMALMNGSKPQLRSEMLAQFRKDQPSQAWPTVKCDRTIAQLKAEAIEIQRKMDHKAAAKAARKRAAKFAKMVADPSPYLRETEQLVAWRSTDTYQQAAQLLADLREALIDTKQSDLAEHQARKLKRMNPPLNHLTAALRRKGFIPK